MPDVVITIEGLSELLSNLSLLPKEIQEEINAEIYDSVTRINGVQRRRAPKDQGGLSRGIGFQKQNTKDGSYYELFSNSEHSGYLEFGTKTKVSIPANLQAAAQEMRGSGISSRLQAKQAIYAWCKRKGIEKKAWYPIFRSIIRTGISPQNEKYGRTPFFFPPIFEEGPRLLQRIQSIVDQNRAI